jgi:hypothetical protein
MAFSFTGYREGQWIRPILDPDLVLKPRLVGIIEGTGHATTVSYRVDASSGSRGFFVLVGLAVILSLLGAGVALDFGLPIPGPAFYAFLLAGVCIAAANGFWETVPKAQQDEAFLQRWLEEVLS